MKSTNIPLAEAEHLIRWYRVEDFLVGSLQELYFNMTYTGCYVCRNTFSIQRRNMDSMLLLLTLEGRGKLRYQEKEYILTPGSVILIDLWHPHEYHALEDGWTFKYLHFCGAMSREYQTYIETRLGPVFTLSRKMYPETEERLDMLYRAAESEEHPDYAAVSGVIYSLLTSFLSEKNTVGSAQKSAEAIRRAAAYITENYSRNITTKEIADAAFLSRSYMSELFVQTYGMPPHEYLVMYRLSHVKERLLNTGISVSEIAESTGFRDVFTLSRVFKQKFGISPSEYRKQMLE